MPTTYNKVTLDGTTLMDISDTTATAADVAQGKYFYTAQGVKTAGTGSGGTPSATAHTIYFEFSDNTNTTITAYYNDSFISDAITATIPTTYGNRTVDLAQLDNVTWYAKPVEHWETIFDETIASYVDGNTWYFWIPSLANVTIPLGSTWRITLDNVEYTLVSKTSYVSDLSGVQVVIGNPLASGQSDDGSGVPFCFYNYNNRALCGDQYNLSAKTYTLKIERLVTE